MITPLWTELASLFASSAYALPRLWIAAILLAIGGPPVFVWMKRHHWQFTLRDLLIAIFVLSASLVWLAPEFSKFVRYSRDPHGMLVDSEYHLPIALAILSIIFTWAACRSISGRK
jgi:hypothetical protein